MPGLFRLAMTVGVPWASVAAAAAQVVVARIEGPIAVTAASGEPYRGSNEQAVAGPGLPPPVLVPYGYVEEEYFVSGTVDGKPYKTSLLVRKPGDPAKFSGLVAVETIHAQGAVPFWGSRPVWLPGGHGWVGMASQRIALESFVKKANPARYASLSVPEAPAGAPVNPMAGNPAQDLISQEIMTQVGALLKSNRPDGPFKGLKVRWLVMGGASQTGGTTWRYIQQSHARAKMPDGTPIYDGYMPQEAFASSTVTAPGSKVLNAVTEGDLVNATEGKRPIAMRADSDDPSGAYRHYEFTGASHVGTRGVKDPLQVFSTLGNAFKPGEQLSQFPQAPVMMAAVDHFVQWVTGGKAPPHYGQIEVAEGKIVRDSVGNARGGIRSPWVDVPTVKYLAAAPTGPGDNPFRRLIGLQEPIPVEQLKAKYGTRANYLKQFDAGIDAMVKAGTLRPGDAPALKQEEAANPPF